nr:putative urease accessory protein ured-like [Quercus suber]
MSDPFRTTTLKAGQGTIHLALLPPNTPRLKTASYQYPLKLISPAPSRNHYESSCIIYTVYLLTYGGGIVAGDTIDLHVLLERTTRLILLTQGSTKLFKSPNRDLLSRQCMMVNLAPGSAICYLPDPVQPFENSCFEQHQIYSISADHGDTASIPSLCVLDWVSNGRSANGENWSFLHYASRNEVYLDSPTGGRKLLLRDNIVLDGHGGQGIITERMHGLAVFGTLILCGPLSKSLGQFFMAEFSALPRIGGRKWDDGSDSGDEEIDPIVLRRVTRQKREAVDGVLWSAASMRGCVLVKLGAPTVEKARQWLFGMLAEEGSLVREFGERALLCLRW